MIRAAPSQHCDAYLRDKIIVCKYRTKSIWRHESNRTELIANFPSIFVQVYAQYNHKSEIDWRPEVNLQVSDEFNLGAGMKFLGKEMKECWPQVVYVPKDRTCCRYWLRGDVTRKIAAGGCDQ